MVRLARNGEISVLRHKKNQFHHGAPKWKTFDIELSGLVVKNAKKRKKKIFFVLLMINLNKFSLLVGHNYKP
jgi:hypothetical protein